MPEARFLHDIAQQNSATRPRSSCVVALIVIGILGTLAASHFLAFQIGQHHALREFERTIYSRLAK